MANEYSKRRDELADLYYAKCEDDNYYSITEAFNAGYDAGFASRDADMTGKFMVEQLVANAKAEAYLEIETEIAIIHSVQDKARIPHLYELGTWCYEKALLVSRKVNEGWGIPPGTNGDRCSHGVWLADRCFQCDPNIGVENRK